VLKADTVFINVYYGTALLTICILEVKLDTNNNTHK